MDTRLYILAGALALLVVAVLYLLISVVSAGRSRRRAAVASEPPPAEVPEHGSDIPRELFETKPEEPLRTGDWRSLAGEREPGAPESVEVPAVPEPPAFAEPQEAQVDEESLDPSIVDAMESPPAEELRPEPIPEPEPVPEPERILEPIPEPEPAPEPRESAAVDTSAFESEWLAALAPPPPPPVAGALESPPPQSPALEDVLPEPPPVADEPEVPPLPPTPAPATSVPDVPDYVMAAPVEMWFGDHRVGVRAGTATFDQFQRFASVLFEELARSRDA